jgi:hypothetical protein
MAKKRKRGRPYNPEAKRHQTTRAGRRGEVERDTGSKQLRRIRRRLTGSEDLPDDVLGVLLGRGLITLPEYQAGRDVAELLDVAGMMGRVHSVWVAVLAGGRFGHTPGEGAAAEWARRALARVAWWIDDEAALALVLAVAGGTAPQALAAEPILWRLRVGLDRAARGWTSRSRAA